MNKKILVVDDDKTVRAVLTMILRGEGYTILEAENGVEGLKLVETELPDLVISDIAMPKMDGLEFCRLVRSMDYAPDTPFLFLTSYNQVNMELEAFRAGANAFMSKTEMVRERLLQEVTVLLKRSDVEDKNPKFKSIEGDMGSMNIPEMLQTFSSTKKSGILTLSRPGEVARIFFVSGVMRHAEYKNWVGEEAIYNLGIWRDGSFGFQVKDVHIQNPTIEKSTMQVIFEYCDRLEKKSTH